MTAPHLEPIPPGLNPGGLWVRLVTTTGEVLADRPLSSIVQAQSLGVADYTKAELWLEEHGEHRVYVIFYDGDSGEVMQVRVHTLEARFVCPRCERASSNPNDIKYGYCGACHAYTGNAMRPPGAWWP